MARPRRPNEPSSYQAQPTIPLSQQRRFELIRAVLGERTTISEAARELGIARVNMQTLVHRAEAAISSSLEPRPTGPPPKPAAEKALEAEVERLTKENTKLTRQLQAADDMMAAAGEIIRSLRGLAPASSRTSSPRSKRSPKTSATDSEPEPEASKMLRRVLEQLRTKSDVGARTARLLGIDVKTLRRWVARIASGQPLVRRRGGVMRTGSPEAEQHVKTLVQDLHGLIGAESLARSVEGVSRRRAAQIKQDVLTSLERTRQRECSHVRITQPGIIRGFDAMHLQRGFALIAADSSVPFRTSATYAHSYDAKHVAATLDEDFRRNGAPLVLRDDRASCHTAEPVVSVLREHGVLLLQGPAYYPQYYGQLERQNREHRQWLDLNVDIFDELQALLDRMKTALNERWRRPTLGWATAAQCWQQHRPPRDDRSQLIDEVHQRAELLRGHDVLDHLAMRLAIEQALTQRGYLRVTPGR